MKANPKCKSAESQGGTHDSDSASNSQDTAPTIIQLPPPAKDPSGLFEVFEPYPIAVDLSELLDELSAFVRRHVVISLEESDAAALWVVRAHLDEICEVSPILAILGPSMRCGKTTLLKIITALVPRAISVSNITPAGIFRIVNKYKPTLAIDEADSFFGMHEELRGILNSGHTRASAFVVRCDSEGRDPVAFSTWCPKVIAKIGELPPTLLDRSIVVRLKRKLPGEEVAPFGARAKQEASLLRAKAARWALDNMEMLRE
jgi:putative DNA primase/helicase